MPAPLSIIWSRGCVVLRAVQEAVDALEVGVEPLRHFIVAGKEFGFVGPDRRPVDASTLAKPASANREPGKVGCTAGRGRGRLKALA